MSQYRIKFSGASMNLDDIHTPTCAQTGRSACERKVDDADTKIALTVATIVMMTATYSVVMVQNKFKPAHNTE